MSQAVNSDPSFPVLCFYAANFATNMKTLQISEFCKFWREYQNIMNFGTIFLRDSLDVTKFKKRRKCAVFYSYFCPIFSLCFPRHLKS